MENDADFLRRYSGERNEAAFAAFVNRNLPLVYSAALRRLDGDAAGAADVAQTVFAQVSLRADRLWKHPCLAGWLYAATRRAASNFSRSERRRKFWENTATEMATESQDDLMEWERLRPLIDDAMDELKASDREAVLLRFFRQDSFAEVGAKLGISENTARMRVDRALDKLRTRLSRRGLVSTTAALALVLGKEAIAAIPADLAATVSAGVLASSAGTSSIVVAAILFMKQTKLIVAAAAFVAALGFGFFESSQANTASVQLAAADQRLASAREQTAALQKRIAKSESEAADAEAKYAALKKTRGDQAAGPKDAAQSQPKRKMFSDPHYSKVFMDQYEKSLPVKYAGLFRALNLTPAQISEFEKALVECQKSVIEIWGAAEQQSLDAGPASATGTAIARMTIDPNRSRDEALTKVLGVNGFDQFRSFDSPQTAAARDAFGAISTALYSAEAPLTAAQGDDLTRIITANTKVVQTPMVSDGGDPMFMQTTRTDSSAVLAAAEPTLSLTQRATLQAAVEQQRTDEALKNFNFEGMNSGNVSANR